MAEKRLLPTDDTAQPELSTPEKKRQCITRQRYKNEYKETWSFLGPSTKGESYVRCSICSTDFSCAHSGSYDCKKHIATKSHMDYAKLKLSQRSVKTMFKEIDNKDWNDKLFKRQVTAAEAKMCELICEMNLPLSSADRFTKQFGKMFTDSKIAAGL